MISSMNFLSASLYRLLFVATAGTQLVGILRKILEGQYLLPTRCREMNDSCQLRLRFVGRAIETVLHRVVS